MKKAIVLLAVLALLLGTAVPSDAWRGHGHFRGGGCCWGWWWPGAIIGGLALGAVAAATAPFIYAPPPVYAAPPVVYQPPPPVVYQQPPAVYQQPPAAPAPPAPLVQREVVYPHGKYVLYGDGVSQPWQWVWVASSVPAPPPPPRY
jgi:hypothetical protein